MEPERAPPGAGDRDLLLPLLLVEFFGTINGR